MQRREVRSGSYQNKSLHNFDVVHAGSVLSELVIQLKSLTFLQHFVGKNSFFQITVFFNVIMVSSAKRRPKWGN